MRAGSRLEVLGVVVLGLMVGGAANAQEIALWASDREAGAVIALDDRGLEVARISGLPSPTHMCPTRLAVEQHRKDGAVWVVVDEPVAGKGAVLIVPSGRRRLHIGAWIGAFREISDLAVSRDGVLLWIVDPASEEVSMGFPPEVQYISYPVPGALSLAPAGGTDMWVGTASGEIWRLPDHAGPVRVGRPGGVLTDLEPAAVGGFWALDAAGQGRVLLLGHDASVLWEGPGLAGAEHLAPAEGSPAVWMASTVEPFLRLQGSRSGQARSWASIPGGPHDRVESDGCGGAWVAAGDRLLRVDSGGGVHQAASGFRRLTGLARPLTDD